MQKQLPTIDAAQIVAPGLNPRLERGWLLDGHAPTEDLELLCRLALTYQPRTIFEFGTFTGLTTYNLARHAPPGCCIFTLDLPREAIPSVALPFFGGEQRYADKPGSGEAFAGTPEADRIVQLFGDSATFSFAPWRSAIDLAFVDASHAYENCLSDSLRAATMRSPRGIITWHDYGVWPGVTGALNDLHRSSAIFAGLRHVAGTSIAVLLPEKTTA